MSKLYKSYKNLKQNNSKKIYLFKSWMFYISETGRIVLEYIELMKRKEVSEWIKRKLL